MMHRLLTAVMLCIAATDAAALTCNDLAEFAASTVIQRELGVPLGEQQAAGLMALAAQLTERQALSVESVYALVQAIYESSVTPIQARDAVLRWCVSGRAV